jgi:regulator of sigma E protease
VTAGAVVIAVLAFAFLVVVHEAGHAVAARLSRMRVERFSVGFGPVLARFRGGETEYALSALPLGGYVKIAGMAPGDEVAAGDPRSYANRPAWQRFLVIAAGPAMNYLLAIAIATVLAASVGVATPDPASRVGRIFPDSPAQEAGLRDGDRIVAIDGRPLATWDELVEAIRNRPGARARLTVERAEGDGVARLELVLVPAAKGGIGVAGVAQHALHERAPGPLAAIAVGVAETNVMLSRNLTAIGQIFTRQPGAPRLQGPAGVGKELVLAAQSGREDLAQLAFALSVALALFNLLPVPGLDGGRLVFLAYEIVARRRANARIESIVHAVGIVALLALVLAVTVFGDLGLFRK